MATRGRPSGLIGPASARPSVAYRALLAVLHVVGHGIFGFRPRLVGDSSLPRDAAGRPVGGWIAAGLPHRTWIDPLLVADLLPRDPRLVFFGDGRAIYRSWWRRALVGLVGGVIPIWPGGHREAVEEHLRAARSALAGGAVLVIFPEVGPPAPLGSARQLGLGVAYMALRSGAPIVPLAIGGSHELFRGRRLVVRVLPPVTWQVLAGLEPSSGAPEPLSPEERRVAHAVVAGLSSLVAPAVAAVHAATEPPADTVKRWTWLTTAWH
jgi:1-acyl-sn-glycerol-3-phosphate acyltransferase